MEQKSSTKQRVSRSKALEIINKYGKQRFFTVLFTKKNGEIRSLTGKLGVTKYLDTTKKSSNRTNLKGLGYLNMYDMLNKGYRNVNLQELKQLKINGIVYSIR